MNEFLQELERKTPTKQDIDNFSLYALDVLVLKLTNKISDQSDLFLISELKGYPKLQYLFRTHFKVAYEKVSKSKAFDSLLMANLSSGLGALEGLKGDNGKWGDRLFPIEIPLNILKKAALLYFKSGKDEIGIFAKEIVFRKSGEVKSFSLDDTFPREAIWKHCIRMAKRKRNSNSPGYSATIFQEGVVAVIGKTRWKVVENTNKVKRWVKT